MPKKIPIYFFLLLLSSYNVFSQCAGINNTITVCDKESDVNYQNLNLFDELGGAPEAGGTWFANSPINQNAINSTTGVINLWAINRFGDHTFTYTNPTCNESAEVTISLGGYPGEDNVDGGANACSDEIVVDLFKFLDNNLVNLTADINGEWTEDPATKTNFLIGNLFNTYSAGPGTYTFYYTTNSFKSCPQKRAKVILEVHRAPEAGEATNIEICDTDDLTPYENINLFDYISGEDTNGIWTDKNSTNQITSPLDHTINIKEIYANFGSGVYEFSYSVLQPHGVCSSDDAIVKIILPKISGQFKVNNLCTGNLINVEIAHTRTLDTNFIYKLEYEIENTITNQIVYNGIVDNINITNTDNTTRNANFSIPANSLPPGSYAIKTTVINSIEGAICNSFIITSDYFTIYEAKAKIEDTCYGENNLNLIIYNFYDDQGNLFTGTKNVDYTITSDTTNATIATDLDFINGKVTLPIDLSNFPVNENDYNFTIQSANQSGLNCINYNFTINRVPEDIQLDISVDNFCNASDLKVGINAPYLADGQYHISYEVIDINSTRVLVENTIVFNGGTANYNIDINNLDDGFYNVILKSTQNDTTPCRVNFDFEVQENFSINGLPEAPVLEANQSFCFSNYAPNSPTLADIIVNSGENLTWYANNTSIDSLNISTPLVNGEDYYVTAKNLNSNCESAERSVVTVTIFTLQIISATNTEPLFCSKENATLANLDAQINSGELLWYDSPSKGNLLSTNTLLINDTTYYATESINGCESVSRVPFNVTIVTPPKPVVEGTTLLCALENPTLFDFESSITNTTNYELIWYDAIEGGLELNNSDLLDINTTYYVASVDTYSGCESERTQVSVTLNNCNPEDYDFFIPDGFSPNNDGTNDYYFIPNIEYFYPEYQLEIFNRYGQSLFKGDIIFPKWDGTVSSGNEATSGVYFYILRYNKSDLKPKQGRIYLSK